MFTVARARAIEPRDAWTSAVCAAMLGGARAEVPGASDFEREVGFFRTSLKAFAPDIRQAEVKSVSFGGDEETSKPAFLTIETTPKQPALQEITYRAVGEPKPAEVLRLAQRAFGIEYDLGRRSDGGFTYGYAIKGRDAVLAHLDQAEAEIAAYAGEAREYLRRNLPPWRWASLGGGAFGLFLLYGQAVTPHLIEIPIIYALLANPVATGFNDVFGRLGRSRQRGYAEHLAFIRRSLAEAAPAAGARAFIGRNLKLDPELVTVLKETDPAVADVTRAIGLQTRLDRAAWYEHVYTNLVHRDGGGALYLPRGPRSDVAFDDMFYVDRDGDPVHIVSARFFSDTPVYPKKPKETKEWLEQLGWQPGAG